MRLQIGDKMPDFTFNTQNAENVHVHDILKGKTIFWCLRYIGCTVCRYDVHCIAERYAEFQEKNAQVLVLMQSDPEHVNASTKDEPLPFSIICDDRLDIYKALEINPALSKEELIGEAAGMEKFLAKREGVKKLGYTHGDYEGDELQLPAMFIVDETGTVTYVRYGKHIADLPTIDEVLAML